MVNNESYWLCSKPRKDLVEIVGTCEYARNVFKSLHNKHTINVFQTTATSICLYNVCDSLAK